MTLEQTVSIKEWRNAVDKAFVLLDKRIRTMAGDSCRYEYILIGDVLNLAEYKAPKCKHLKLAVAMYKAMPDDQKGRIILIPRKVTGFFPATDSNGNPLLNDKGLPQIKHEERPIAWLEQEASKPYEAPQFKIAQPELAFLIKLKD